MPASPMSVLAACTTAPGRCTLQKASLGEAAAPAAGGVVSSCWAAATWGRQLVAYPR